MQVFKGVSQKIKLILPTKILLLFREINAIIRQPWYKDNLINKDTYQFLIFQKALMKLRKLIYKGKNVFCLICEQSFRKFLSPSDRCPYCGSLRRHRLLIVFLKYKTNFFSDKQKVLHISPNKFLQIMFKNRPNLDYISVGLNPSAMIKMDITKLLFEENSFDVILCYHVLEHIKDDILALKELYRVLKPNGWAIIQSPIDWKREKTFEYPNITLGVDNHVRIYGRDYKERLKEVKFKVKADNLAGKFGENRIKKFGLDKNEKLYFCIK